MAHLQNKTSTASPHYSDLLDTLSHLLRRSHFHAEKLFAQSFGEQDLTSRQLALLVAISKHRDVSQRKVGELIALDMNTISDLLRRMEKKGLIERTRSPKDGRSVSIRLSPIGQEKLAAVYEDHVQYQQQLAQRLNPSEVEQMKMLLRKLLNL